MNRDRYLGAGDLYDALWLEGFRLSETADGRLAVSPAGKLSAQQRAAVKAHRGALLALVRMLEAERATKGVGR